MVGVVTEVGSKVQKFKVRDKVGVGYLVNSCRSCQNCGDNLENYCPNFTVTSGAKYIDGTITYGGYSGSMDADECFVISIPDGLPLDAAAPLLCAGITVYSPLKYYGLDKPGLHIGVVGLGGLGHMAVKFAKALGAYVIVISTSPSKKKEAIEHLGGDSFLISRDEDQMQVETNKVFLRDTSVISPYSILLFGGSINVQHQSGLITIDGWLKLTAPAQIAVLFKELRLTLHSILKELIRKPENAMVLNNEIIKSIITLLLEEGNTPK